MKLNILMLGEDIRQKGGIASVTNTLLRAPEINRKYNINHLATYSGKTHIIRDFIKALFIFFRLLLFKKIDLIHLHSAADGSFYRKSIFILISSVFRKKAVLHIHSGHFGAFYEKSRALKKKYIETILSIPQTLIVVSNALKAQLVKIVKDPGKVEIVVNPVELPPEHEYRRDTNENKTTKIVFMGRLNAKKGIYDLIEAAEKLLAETKDVFFILCGDGEMRKVKDLIEEKGIAKYFSIPGRVDDKHCYLSGGDIFVLPSYFEGIPISVLEAAGYKLPVVATAAGGTPEVVCNNENGFLIEPGNIESLKEKLLVLINSPELRIRMGKKAYEVIKNKFDIRVVEKKLDSIYQNLLENPPAS